MTGRALRARRARPVLRARSPPPRAARCAPCVSLDAVSMRSSVTRRALVSREAVRCAWRRQLRLRRSPRAARLLAPRFAQRRQLPRSVLRPRCTPSLLTVQVRVQRWQMMGHQDVNDGQLLPAEHATRTKHISRAMVCGDLHNQVCNASARRPGVVHPVYKIALLTSVAPDRGGTACAAQPLRGHRPSGGSRGGKLWALARTSAAGRP